MRASILGYGMYVPRSRLKVEEISAVWGGPRRMERSVANIDEDVITMAAEAADSALIYAGIAGSELDAIYFGTNSSPYIEGGVTALLVEVLYGSADVCVADFSGSPRASTAALMACIDGIESGRFKKALVIGADNRPAPPGSGMEGAFGAGAVALVIGKGDGVAIFEEMFSYTRFFMDRWRASEDEFVREYDPRFTREYGFLEHSSKAIEGLSQQIKKNIEDFDHIVLQQLDVRGPKQLANKIKAPKGMVMADPTFPYFGDIGAASMFMGLTSVFSIAKENQKILAVSYGAGASDAISLTMGTSEGVNPSPSLEELKEKKTYIAYIDYLKLCGILNTGEPPFPLAVPPVSPAFMRGREELLRMESARCTSCGYLNYPPSIRTICVRCGSTDFEKTVLSKRGTIHTYCVNYYMPPGFETPLANILVDLESGGRFMGMGTEVRPEELEVGMPVKLVLRKITKERGASVYGYKVKPIR